MPSIIESTAVEIGRLDALDPDGYPLVRTSRGSAAGPERAWLGIKVTEAELKDLVARNERVLLVRSDDLADACVIVGVLRERAQPEADIPRELVLEATERLVVRCGSARIVLHGDGRLEAHAERISQRARGVHTIKGAAVRIN